MTMMRRRSPIVVGTDGSVSALHAVRRAASEARRRHVPLRVVHVCALVPPAQQDTVGHLTDYAGTVFEQGRRWLTEAADAARAAPGALEVSTGLLNGTVAKALVDESETARLLVLGARGLGGFTELLVGSVAVAVSAHAHCPVAVIRSSTVDNLPPVTGPVVVGVDGSPLSEAAIAFGFDAAAARGVAVHAVHSWLDTEMTGAWTPLPSIVDWAAVHAEEERVLAERLAGWQEKYPTVEVRRMVSKDRPAWALLRRAENAQLIVVGSRGHGALTGRWLGSVSQHLLHHATCPVVIVRPEKSRS